MKHTILILATACLLACTATKPHSLAVDAYVSKLTQRPRQITLDSCAYRHVFAQDSGRTFKFISGPDTIRLTNTRYTSPHTIEGEFQRDFYEVTFSPMRKEPYWLSIRHIPTRKFIIVGTKCWSESAK